MTTESMLYAVWAGVMAGWFYMAMRSCRIKLQQEEHRRNADDRWLKTHLDDQLQWRDQDRLQTTRELRERISALEDTMAQKVEPLRRAMDVSERKGG